MVKPTQLTARQKLAALALKYYSDMKWTPKSGDYYTSCRNDLELYQVIDVTETEVVTVYCDPNITAEPAHWPKDDFLSRDTFGSKRVYVHSCLLEGDSE